MASLNSGGYYGAIYQKGRSRAEREDSLWNDYQHALNSYKKTKNQLLYSIIAVWALFIIFNTVGYTEGWIIGALLMNIVAFNYGGYAYYEVIEKARYKDALEKLEKNIENGE